MTSRFKAVTEPIPPSSLDSGTADKAQPSLQYPSSDNTPKNTATINPPLIDTLKTDNSDLPKRKTSRKIETAALMFKASVDILRKAGLIKGYKMLSEVDESVVEIRLVLSAHKWTTALDLQVLSDED